MYVVSDFLVTNEQLARPRGRARRERGGRTEEGDWEREKARQAGRRATEKGAEQTGEVLVLDDGGGLHSLTPQLHTLCTRRQVVCRRENIKIQGACEMGNGIG